MKPIYEIEVSRMKPDCYAYEHGCSYGLSMHKKIGDSSGYGAPIANKDDLIRGIKNMIDEWKDFDNILGRLVDQPDMKNTVVTVEKGLEKELINQSEIWSIVIQSKNGSKDLRSYFGNTA